MRLLNGMELVALAALGSTAICLGISDWRRRAVDMYLIIACYGASACVNGAVILAGSLAGPDIDSFMYAPTILLESAGASVLQIVRPAAGSIFAVLFLSGVLIAFNRLGLLASGDALAVPAIISMLVLVASPIEIILYFSSAMTFVLALSGARNVRNNIRYRNAAAGRLWRRLYLMLFCYYGDGDSCRYAFRYSGPTRRDYESEPYYTGREKIWLVPGLPLLAGFAPATVVLFVMMFLQP
jgi:hypothetical protein